MVYHPAATLITRTASCLIYYELQQDKPYQELCENFFDFLNKEALGQRLLRRLENLGYRVELHPEASHDSVPL